MFRVSVTVARYPPESVASPTTGILAASPCTVIGEEHDVTEYVVSVHANVTVTSDEYQPAAFGALDVCAVIANGLLGARTVKFTLLLGCPLTVTITGPETALTGTVACISVEVR